MKHLILCFLALLMIGCNKNQNEDIEHLNGYWEIKEVTLPDGSKRAYNYNETIDFIQINDSLTGFRKKLNPNFDGTFSTTDDIETLKVVFENDSLNIYYQTDYAVWKETVLKVSKDELIVQNPQNLRYVYKRYEPLDLN